MTEKFEKLEAELAVMRPRAVRDDVMNRIGERIEAGPSRSWSDRCLVGAMSVGSLAACAIVAMLILQSPGSPRPGAPLVTVPAASRMGDASLVLAQADASWSNR